MKIKSRTDPRAILYRILEVWGVKASGNATEQAGGRCLSPKTINPFFVTVLPSIESEDMVVPLKDNCLAGKLCFKIKTNKIWICFARHQPLCGIVGTWRRENFLNASKALSPACCIISIEATHCI